MSFVPDEQPSSTLLPEMTLAEKCRLVGGATSWRTHAIDRLGIPAVKMSDGPNGVRGEHSGMDRTPSVVIPVGITQGATWDPDLVGRLGDLLGREARRKGAHVVLAPAVNLHRTPIGGRTFEYFSEDPELTAAFAVAVVQGVQTHDVAVAVKHFVANDTEVDRYRVDVEVDERVLRELYLRPFEAAVRDGGAWGVMSAYNRLRAEHCAASHWLLTEVLRDEWGFDGYVVSDWYGAHDTVGGAVAGLSIEMPGPARIYGQKLEAAVADGRVEEKDVDRIAHDVLVLIDRVKAKERSADVPEQSVDDPADRALCRAAAAAGTVLARNERDALPLAGNERIALIGPNAAATRIMGGGSSALRPLPHRMLLEEMTERFATLVHEPGCRIDRYTPLLGADEIEGPDGAPGLEVRIVNGSDPHGEAAHTTRVDTSTLRLFGSVPAAVGSGPCVVTIRGFLRPVTTGRHTLGVILTAPASVVVAGDTLRTADQPLTPGDTFFGYGSGEELTELELTAGEPVAVDITMALDRPFAGVRIGLQPPDDPTMLERAVEAARVADAAVVVVGTNDEWETEGSDRSDISLPGRQDELVARVAAVNPRTIVVVNAGAPVAMPWLDDVAAVLLPFFGGQEMAPALVDVLTGVVDPGGRLPISFPRRLEDAPAMRYYAPADGKQVYAEGFGMGYRGHDRSGTAPLLPFGHGLSYGEAVWHEPLASTTTLQPDGEIAVTVPVTAIGARDATVVVQGYVAPLDPPVDREPKALRTWVKAVVAAGTTVELVLRFDARAFRRWDPSAGQWTVDPGRYDLLLAASATDIRHTITVSVDEALRTW